MARWVLASSGMTLRQRWEEDGWDVGVGGAGFEVVEVEG